MKLKPEKNSGLNRIWTHELCDTGAVLYQLSYEANWELVTLWVHNIPIHEEIYYKWIYGRSYIWTAEKDRWKQGEYKFLKEPSQGIILGFLVIHCIQVQNYIKEKETWINSSLLTKDRETPI